MCTQSENKRSFEQFFLTFDSSGFSQEKKIMDIPMLMIKNPENLPKPRFFSPKMLKIPNCSVLSGRTFCFCVSGPRKVLPPVQFAIILKTFFTQIWVLFIYFQKRISENFLHKMTNICEFRTHFKMRFSQIFSDLFCDFLVTLWLLMFV